MNISEYLNKVDGSTLTASEWNGCMTKIQQAVTNLENSSTGGGGGSPYVYKSDKNNLNIEAPSSWKDATTGKGGKINLESPNDIQFKPGDDIIFYSHHRASGNQNEITVKTAKTLTDNTDVPVKLQLNLANLTISTKDKDMRKLSTSASKSENEIFDIVVSTGLDKQSGNNTRGYLKVRARAIDIRCEEHGGIALQPKGCDSSNHMNKIKFEHGGGDGLEFGTFNAEKTSVFTDEYRFNKNGIWKMATRQKLDSSKYDVNDPTTQYVYKKNTADDFYDFFSDDDPTTTTKHLIKTANALNTYPGMKTEITNSGNCKISSTTYYTIIEATDQTEIENPKVVNLVPGKPYEKSDLKDAEIDTYIDTNYKFKLTGYGTTYYQLKTNISPKITISSDEELTLESNLDDVAINAADSVKVEAAEIRLNAINADKSGGLVNFGVSSTVQFLTSKFTKAGNVEETENPAKLVLGIQNNTNKTIYRDNDGYMHRASDLIYLDAEKSTQYDPTTHTEGVAIYDVSGNLIPASSTMFVKHTNNKIYKVETKTNTAVTSKSNTLIAQIIDGVYTPSTKKDGTQYCPKLRVEDADYVGTGLKEIPPLSVAADTSVNISDIAILVNWMKEHNQGPWSE